MSWVEICEQHPDEWVCLIDVDNEPDGPIRSARVLGHERSMRVLLAEVGTQADMVVVHTSGRPLWSPQIELTDEIRDIVRPRR